MLPSTRSNKLSKIDENCQTGRKHVSTSSPQGQSGLSAGVSSGIARCLRQKVTIKSCGQTKEQDEIREKKLIHFASGTVVNKVMIILLLATKFSRTSAVLRDRKHGPQRSPQ